MKLEIECRICGKKIGSLDWPENKLLPGTPDVVINWDPKNLPSGIDQLHYHHTDTRAAIGSYEGLASGHGYYTFKILNGDTNYTNNHHIIVSGTAAAIEPNN